MIWGWPNANTISEPETQETCLLWGPKLKKYRGWTNANPIPEPETQETCLLLGGKLNIGVDLMPTQFLNPKLKKKFYFGGQNYKMDRGWMNANPIPEPKTYEKMSILEVKTKKRIGVDLCQPNFWTRNSRKNVYLGAKTKKDIGVEWMPSQFLNPKLTKKSLFWGSKLKHGLRLT